MKQYRNFVDDRRTKKISLQAKTLHGEDGRKGARSREEKLFFPPDQRWADGSPRAAQLGT